jgi:hypothetical protein
MWFAFVFESRNLMRISERGSGWRELKLSSLPVAAALEEIRAAIRDSLLRTGARLGYHRLAGGLLNSRILGKARLDTETFGSSTELHG